jgi:hypothetical protein
VPGLGAKPGKRMSITDMRNFTKKGDKLGSAGIKDICVKLGWSSNSFSYAVHKAMKAKVLRRVAVGEYEVI